MQTKLEDHSFDVDGSVERIRAALRSRGVDDNPNYDTEIAKTFAARAETRSPPRKGENLAAHPFWTHLELTHGVRQHAPIDGCPECALLYAWWRPYWLKLQTRRRAAIQAVASSAAQARPLLRAVRSVIPDRRGDHSTIHMSMRYAHLAPRAGAELISALEHDHNERRGNGVATK